MPGTRTRSLLRLTAWTSVLLLVVLSLIPKELEIRTSLAGTFEHAIAYGFTGMVFVLAYPAANWWPITAALFALSGLLELLQNFVPGRNPEIAGAVFSSGGAAAGAILGSLVASFRNRRDRSPGSQSGRQSEQPHDEPN